MIHPPKTVSSPNVRSLTPHQEEELQHPPVRNDGEVFHLHLWILRANRRATTWICRFTNEDMIQRNLIRSFGELDVCGLPPHRLSRILLLLQLRLPLVSLLHL